MKIRTLTTNELLFDVTKDNRLHSLLVLLTRPGLHPTVLQEMVAHSPITPILVTYSDVLAGYVPKPQPKCNACCPP